MYDETLDYVNHVARNSHIQINHQPSRGIFSLGKWQLSLEAGWHILFLDLNKHLYVLEIL